MARETLLIGTNNAHKVTELRRILGEADVTLLTPADAGIDIEVEETGETFEENARLKARAFCAASGLPSLADDSGIEVDALGGRPRRAVSALRRRRPGRRRPDATPAR